MAINRTHISFCFVGYQGKIRVYVFTTITRNLTSFYVFYLVEELSENKNCSKTNLKGKTTIPSSPS
jgi:hypothetical protein